MNDYRIIPSIILLCLLTFPIQQSVAQQAADQDTEVATLEEVVVVGSRVPTRSAHDSPVPIDVIDGKSLRNYGVRDLNSLLRATVPSYNVAQQPLSDAATLVRPANLRGLPPDSTLILVNGKRRHRSSIITLLGGGLSNGSHAPDIAAIPAIALKRVEVLRDGAAAQYGSDAIAGVINFQLKDAPDSRTVETRWGKYYAGDGDASSIAANLGMPLDLPFIQSGFANLSFEYGQSAPTVRSDHNPAARDIIAARQEAGLAPTVASRTQFWGAPEFNYDYKLFGNLGMKLNSKSEIYAFGNYAQRKIEGGFYYRSPNARSGVFNGPVVNSQDEVLQDRDGKVIVELDDKYPDDYKNADLRGKNKLEAEGFTDAFDTVKVADLSGNGEGCPTVHRNAAADYDENIQTLPPHCFMFNEKFPGGFTPRFGGTVRDWSGAVGIRGEISDWHYDLSAVFGQHSTEFFMKQTINPQLAGRRTNIPTNYTPGGYTERDRVFNLDLARALPTTMFYSPLNIGLGLEYRIEEFEISAGDRNSSFVDDKYDLAGQGFSIGSNGFVGFPPRIAKKANRGSYAAYVDLETNVSKNLLVGAAGRYEKFETFGDTLNGKLDARWQAAPMMALRGSISTGFRVPTVGQANLQSVTTEATTDGDLQDKFNFPTNLLAAAGLESAKPLTPEKSFNLSAGTVVDVGGLSVTVDYYRIQVRDRIAQTGNVTVPDDVKANLSDMGVSGAESIGVVTFFTNTFGTITNGVDIVATYPMAMAGGNTLWTFAGNFNETEVVDRTDTDIINDYRVIQLQQTLPTMRFTLTSDHRQGAWRFLGRVYWYNSFTEYTAGNGPANRVDAGQQWLVDFETSYTMKTGLTISAGAQNLFDSYPDRTTGVSGTKYPEFSPYGFNGGYYYLRALYAF